MISPYLDWISNHLRLHDWQHDLVYSYKDIVTIGQNIYLSLSDNNIGNHPKNSNYWTKLL